MPNVGIDISDTSLKYVQFDRRHAHDKALRLKKWGDIDIPIGVLERGNVHDVDKLAAVLKEVRNACGTQYARLSLPEERAYLFEVSLNSTTPFKEIRGLLEFRLEENVPLSPRDVYFDYDIVSIDEGKLRVIVAVYAKEIINNYYEACMRAGILPLSFEIESQAIARSSVSAKQKGTFLIIDFGKTRMGVGIVYKGVLMYTSTIDIGGNVLSQAMRDKLGNLSESELTTIKNTQGIINSVGNQTVYQALRAPLATIVEELETRIHYWDTRDGDDEVRAIEKIILCGGSANLEGMPEYLETALKIQTERAQVWQNAFSIDDFVPAISRRYSYGYATAIGLALTDFVSTTV